MSKDKQSFINEICEFLGAVYKEDSGLRQLTKKGLEKLNKQEIAALHTMVTTSVRSRNENS